MINVDRDPKPPPSLQSLIIKTYRNEDVLEKLESTFFSKCYLSEEKHNNAWIMDIDHFHSQAEFPDRIHDWSNLYPINPAANQSKPKKTPEGGYLDPCDPSDDVEKEIVYVKEGVSDNPGFEPLDPNNIKATNSAELLRKIHNGVDGNRDSQKRSAELRFLIIKRAEKIYKIIIEWQGAQLRKDFKEEARTRNILKYYLSRRNSFTMLMRALPPVQKEVLPIVGDGLFD